MSLTDSRASTDRDDAEQEQRLFALLDGYLESVRSGECDPESQTPPEELLEAFPELGQLLDCIDSLESAGQEWNPPEVSSPSAESGEDQETVCAGSVTGGSSLQQLPCRFGNYELQEIIGRGGMGVVYRARHVSLDSFVAIKLIRANQLATQDELKRFYQEARAAAGLRHSHIVKVHDVGEYEGQHYLAMDLVEGDDLSQMIAPGRPLSGERAAEIMAEVARAVHYLHQHDIVHRDLKPSNILIDANGEPHLTDFGLAKLLSADSRETTTGTIIGTPSYMAPEQAGGHSSRVTPLSDVYSLGAILYELLTGQPVFREENPLDTLLCVLEREPQLPRSLNAAIPTELEQICLRCLEKAPERRYASALDVAEDLERYLQSEPLQLPAVSLGHRLRRWGRRKPAFASRSLGLTFIAVIVQGNYLIDGAGAVHHWSIMGVLLTWGALSYLLQRLLSADYAPRSVEFAWASVDAVLFTALLLLANGPPSSLLAGYPLLIAAAGLWFRVRLVFFMTGVCLAGFLVVSALRTPPDQPGHYPGIVGAILLVMGGIVAYQVRRIRVLSRYFERRASR